MGLLILSSVCDFRDVFYEVTCFALHRAYRVAPHQVDLALRLLYLRVPRDELAHRLRKRRHFMPASPLDSQMATLEEPAMDECAIGLH